MDMEKDKPVQIRRSDYKVFDFILQTVDLDFDLGQEKTMVTCRTQYIRNPKSSDKGSALRLYGEELELVSVKINDNQLRQEQYTVTDRSLTIRSVPEEFVLEIVNVIYPEKNSSLEGLYRSSGNYCTQCEAEGFRKITYHPDRPDVLSAYTTRIEASRDLCPVMLSNGNLVESGDVGDSRHYVVWEDPYPKPSYLFALVAGNLVAIEDEFVTKSGRLVTLKIYVEERNREKCDHAMNSLKKAMKWDEEIYGLEYDLEMFMIVAVDDFNMGAMENKGLNIFNSKYVLTTQETGTDLDFLGVEGVISHEYFHNWTGNRVTCRDWFQLSLKEGLTVFRDQEFSSDMNSRPVQRIEDVRSLKDFQFKEDASPMAHPVRPESYIEINNFYTSTVYNKGAEVIRMMHTLLGKENFRAGMDLYFKRHDGQAVTCDDFVAAMSDASGRDLEKFKRWYSQAGTPRLDVKTEWDRTKSEYKILIRQSCPPTPGQPEKLPFHMPVKIGLLDEHGNSLCLTSEKDDSEILELTEQEQGFVFHDIRSKPTLSFLRDFSAPVRVGRFQSRAELANLAMHDKNHFNRWDSFTRLTSEVILEISEDLELGKETVVDQGFLKAVSSTLQSGEEDPALLALSLKLPSESSLAQEVEVVDPDNLHYARETVRKTTGRHNKDRLLQLYHDNHGEKEYSIEPLAMARRGLKNITLTYLMGLDPLPDEIKELCLQQYYQAQNMTDCVGALSCLTNIECSEREDVFKDFYAKWSESPLVIDKWFALQGLSTLPDTLDKVLSLMEDSAFTLNNPNKVRALIGSFCSGNHFRFHSKEGEGYRFLGDRILELNGINPQIAARLVSPIIQWRRYEPHRQELMRSELERIIAQRTISKDVYEIVFKSLAQS